ncbi:MAG: DUF1294 domain-containing protein [Porphyromonadaceae bacterium]|nr:DUF1294 domain-containing protein [Porphyromonadaceae bacterium]
MFSLPFDVALWGYLILMNLIAFALYGIDKRRAKQGAWRISEYTLLLVALLGGSLGALLGMRYFHHKTRHRKFRYGVPLILLLQLGLGLYLFLLLLQAVEQA